MNVGEAVGVFYSIEHNEIPIETKLEAVKRVCNMETINGISKDALLTALKYVTELISKEWLLEAMINPAAAQSILQDIIRHPMDLNCCAEIVAHFAPWFDELSPKAALNIIKRIVRCGECEHRIDHHYEKEGEPPYIKCTCGSKCGLTTNYAVSPHGDFCSWGERSKS